MLYFKHSELANKYHVSLKTVHNWIDAAKTGKLDLELTEKGSRSYISNVAKNLSLLEKLSSNGKKYRNARFHKVVTPKPEFYDIYNKRQILDIVSNITVHREIPRQYNYFDKGATNWDDWLTHLENDQSPNILNRTLELVETNMRSLELLINGFTKVNIIDVGVGNAAPAKGIIDFLHKKKLLNRYIALDISEAMLDIAERNVNEWFGGDVKFEGYARDVSYERFDDLLVEEMLSKGGEKTLNLVLLLGGTPTNLRVYSDMMRVIYASIGENDLIMYADKADSEVARRYLDFSPNPGQHTLSPNHRFILNLLNIDDSLYDVEMGFDKAKRMRFIRIILKTPITIKFEFPDTDREIQLEKGDPLLLLRVWHKSSVEIIDEFSKVGFQLLQSSVTKDRQYVLTISGVDTNSDFGNPS